MSKNITLIIFALFCCTYFYKTKSKEEVVKEKVLVSEKTFFKGENDQSSYIFDNNFVFEE